MCQFEVLQAGVEGPFLHRPGNWLVRQLNDEPKPVYKVGFIREKRKATAREVQWSLETSGSLLEGEGWGFYGCSNSGLGGFFSLAVDSQAFSGELIGLHLVGGGEAILGAFCSSALWQIYQTLYLLFRTQKCSLPLPLRMQE
jgi:hypothetical protein